jgi:hypothetical protein
LSEDCVDERKHHLALTFAGMGQGVAHEVHAAPLPRRFEDFSDGRFETHMCVRNHEFDPAKPSATETAQEVRPEGFGLTRTDRHPQDLTAAIGVHRNGDYHRD